jgi:hypothetical protein
MNFRVRFYREKEKEKLHRQICEHIASDHNINDMSLPSTYTKLYGFCSTWRSALALLLFWWSFVITVMIVLADISPFEIDECIVPSPELSELSMLLGVSSMFLYIGIVVVSNDELSPFGAYREAGYYILMWFSKAVLVLALHKVVQGGFGIGGRIGSNPNSNVHELEKVAVLVLHVVVLVDFLSVSITPVYYTIFVYNKSSEITSQVRESFSAVKMRDRILAKYAKQEHSTEMITLWHLVTCVKENSVHTEACTRYIQKLFVEGEYQDSLRTAEYDLYKLVQLVAQGGKDEAADKLHTELREKVILPMFARMFNSHHYEVVMSMKEN